MHSTCDTREKGVVYADADVFARHDESAALAHDYFTYADFLTVGAFDAEILRIRIGEVFSCSACFGCCHNCLRYDVSNMPNIHEWGQKIKVLGHDAIGEWGLFAIVFLLALASFGLGRLSALEDVKPPVAITEAPTTQKPAALFMGGLLVASRSGSVYYYPWCSGATKILPANQRWFASEVEAKNAGYTPAKGCKGLEQ